ncbi:MAG: glycoside hydrolase family 13 protein [Actinomycetota bacterium]
MGRHAASAPHLLDLPHHDGSPLYLDDDAPSLGGTVTVRLRVPHAYRAHDVVVRQVRDGEPHLVTASVEREDDVETWWAAELTVHNPVTSYRFFLHGQDGGYRWLNAFGLHERDVTDTHDFRVVTHAPPPEWVRDAVVYQVFPDRFARSGAEHPTPPWAEPAAWDDEVIHKGDRVERQWFGGDLAGIEAHLDHVVELGATVLYLTPVFEAGSNHRYDAVTFDRVAPELGGDEALASLTRAAHERGLKVLGDLTTNHTGVGHEWFRRAVEDPAAPEAAYYRFREHPHDYVSWLDIPSLPKLDHTSAEMRRALYEGPDSVVARWLRDPVALDGWRVDVANMTGRYADVDLAHDVARAVRETMAAVEAETGRTTWLLAEHGHDASADLLGDGWHGTMNYSGFTRPVWAWLTAPGHGLTFLGLPVEVPSLPATAVTTTMREFAASVPWRAWATAATLLCSHDTPRIRTVVGGGTAGGLGAGDAGRDRHLAALALLAGLPGVPTVFAGDELGLTAVDGEHARTPFPWHRRQEWDDETLVAYRTWLRLRRERVALRRGGLRWVHVGPDSVTFLREHPTERVLVHVARADHEPVRLPLRALHLSDVSGTLALYGDSPVREDASTLVLPALGPAAHAYLLPPPGGR